MSVENKAPLPGGGTSDRPAVSRQRHSVLQQLRSRPQPVTATVLAQECGLHVNTVREHLDALVEIGLAVRERAPAAGRGRPAWRYRSRPPQQSPVREYAGLAAVLAGQIARSSADPKADALAAGHEWGRALIAGQEVPGTAAQARARVLTLLDQIGFAPEADHAGGHPGEDRVRLPRCPFIEVAREYPGVICNVHAGLIQACYAALGGDPDGVSLHPFAESGACLLSFSTGEPGEPTPQAPRGLPDAPDTDTAVAPDPADAPDTAGGSGAGHGPDAPAATGPDPDGPDGPHKADSPDAARRPGGPAAGPGGTL